MLSVVFDVTRCHALPYLLLRVIPCFWPTTRLIINAYIQSSFTRSSPGLAAMQFELLHSWTTEPLARRLEGTRGAVRGLFSWILTEFWPNSDVKSSNGSIGRRSNLSTQVRTARCGAKQHRPRILRRPLAPEPRRRVHRSPPKRLMIHQWLIT